MRIKNHGVLLIAAFALTAQAQQQVNPLATAPGSGSSPPGAQRPQPLPPGLNRHRGLPLAPLQNRQQVQTPGGSANPAQAGAVAEPRGRNTTGQPFTNELGNAGTNLAEAMNPHAGLTNSELSLTNESAGTNQALPTSRPPAMNRIYTTNPHPASVPGAAPRTKVVTQDQAATVTDQNLLIALRKRVPVVASPGTVERINFIAREGVVTLVGEVPSQRESQRIVEFIGRTPGVVQVLNQLQESAEGDANAGR